MKRIDPDIDSGEFEIPTLYTTDHHIQQSQEQIEQLQRRIDAARGYVETMRHRQRQARMLVPFVPPRPSLWARIVRDYRRIVETGHSVYFYIALASCAVIIAVGIYSMLERFGEKS